MKDTKTAFGKEAGTYALVMQLPRTATLPVGQLGPVTFAAGYYVYPGSACGPGGLAARFGHQLKPSGQSHWRIDYLRQFAQVKEIWYTIHPKKVECHWAQLFHNTRGAGIIAPGFGASDCRCSAHLVYFKRKPGIRTFRQKVAPAVFCKGMEA